MRLHEIITIDARVNEVFDGWADLERSPEHQRPTVERSKITDGPVGVGTRYRAVDRWPGRRVTFVMEITEFDPPKRISARWFDPMAGTWTAVFEAVGESRTRMSFDTVIEPKGLLGLLDPVMSRWAGRQLRQGLDSFRRWVEEPKTLNDPANGSS